MGQILIEAVTTSQDIWVVLESIDALMDVFAEDSNNLYLKELNILSSLQAILPQLKSKVIHSSKNHRHSEGICTMLHVMRVIKITER